MDKEPFLELIEEKKDNDSDTDIENKYMNNKQKLEIQIFQKV